MEIISREHNIDFDRYLITNDGQIFSKSKYYKKECKGNTDRNGYVTVHLKNTDGSSSLYKKHRVIWTFFNGRIPDNIEIDHINTIKGDNRLCNLRLATRIDNVNNPLTKEKQKKAHSGEKNHFYGKHHTEETKRKMSKKALINYVKRERNNIGRFV